MKLKKVLSLLLALVMTASLLTLPAHAEDAGGEETSTTAATVNFTDVAPFLPPVSGGVRMQRAASFAAANFAANDAANFAATDNGMKISKTATPNVDGSYTITLEAYATGSKVITEQKTDIPTDIILVLDQSGSMDETMSTYGFREYTGKSNSDFYALRHNGARNPNLYYKLDDGSYATVSVEKNETLSYEPLQTGLVNYKTSWGSLTTECYYYYADNLYEKDTSGEYLKVSLTRDWISNGFLGLSGYYRYTYKFSNGDEIPSDRDEGVPNLGSHGPLYYSAVDTTKTAYTYTYTDKDGETQTIGTSTGADTQPTDFTLYERYRTGSKSRLNALKDAVTNFTNAVAKKAAGKDGDITTTGDNINHRIAVVGFASSGTQYNSNKYENTEVFVGAAQYKYGESAKSQYRNALQSMDTAAGKNNITSSIGALDAYGGTFTDLGMEMANGIFENNPIPDGQNRNRVIIVFTDGYPGTGDTVSSTVANDAVSRGYTAKQSTADGGYGATVYTVGIFSGADGTPVESFSGVSNPNKFMHLLSSNYKTAQSYSDSSKYGTATYPAGGGSYYLSAADADSLNSIFEQISDQIETGGSSSTLTSDAVVKDIIAPQFTLPAGASADSITLETYAYGGKDTDTGNDKWTKNATAMGAEATISSTDESKEITKDNQVSVTGFNFSDNWCGMVKNADGSEIPRGNKLVISFKVEPRDKFLGGNGVNTNTDAGIYKDKDAKDPILKFEKPNVDVDIKEPTITAPDANVYLGAYFEDTIPADELKKGTSISFDDGKITLDMTKPNENWGLEDWQTEYVNISVTVKDKDGTEVTDFKNLKEDTDYTVSISITPKKPKTDNNGFQEDAKGTIHVFTPELTFQDSTAYYGEAVSNNYDTANKVAEKWTHDGKYSTDEGVQMLGNKPTLNLNYTPDSTKITADNKYGKKDVPVSVTVKIGNEDVTVYTTFVHQACAPDCGWTTPNPANGDPAFLVHIKTCTLNITKAGGADDESYVFDVYKDSVKYSEVTVWGNGTETLVELPVGTYTIVEDSNWSWRYGTQSYSDAVTLDSSNTTGIITCTNTKTVNSWLNGFSTVVRNIFGIGKK